MVPLLILLADVDALVAKARAVIAPERGCARSQATDVTVCGRRAADRFRVPFTGYDPGDPRAETVAGERHRLLNKTNNCREMRAMQTGCGFAGVKLTTGGGKGPQLSGRKPAP